MKPYTAIVVVVIVLGTSNIKAAVFRLGFRWDVMGWAPLLPYISQWDVDLPRRVLLRTPREATQTHTYNIHTAFATIKC